MAIINMTRRSIAVDLFYEMMGLCRQLVVVTGFVLPDSAPG